jgi:hypothetical protein
MSYFRQAREIMMAPPPSPAEQAQLKVYRKRQRHAALQAFLWFGFAAVAAVLLAWMTVFR